MRIISGTYKGRRFQLPKGLMARPTTDFAKESLFNILTNQVDFEELRVLDLFSGTGSIGFECISRGAAQVTCVENYPLHVKFIRSVIQKIEIKNMTVIQGDVFRFIEDSRGTFDLIFADAPFSDERLGSLPDRLFRSTLLAEEGLLVMEHSKKTDFSRHPCFKEERKYGNVHFSFFQKNADIL
jgi:16S rRNA (guanine(966)-N(2))-methyltransferase RsmD